LTREIEGEAPHLLAVQSGHETRRIPADPRVSRRARAGPAYELTPGGIKKTRDVPLESGIRHLTGQKLNYFVAGALAAAIVFFALDRSVLDEDLAEPLPVAANGPATEGTEEARNSIIVLPFANISSDPEQEYFADGLSEELTNSLAQIHNLRVAGRTSAFYFKGRNEDLRTSRTDIARPSRRWQARAPNARRGRLAEPLSEPRRCTRGEAAMGTLWERTSAATLGGSQCGGKPSARCARQSARTRT
jgi:hypothetical protein